MLRCNGRMNMKNKLPQNKYISTKIQFSKVTYSDIIKFMD